MPGGASTPAVVPNFRSPIPPTLERLSGRPGPSLDYADPRRSRVRPHALGIGTERPGRSARPHPAQRRAATVDPCESSRL